MLTHDKTDGKSPGYLGKLYGMVRANHCMPADRSVYYFEVTIEKGQEIPENDPIPEIGIGFCEEGVPLNGMVGWDEGSWGFHGIDGNLYEEYGRSGRSYSGPFTEGAVIGCGVNFKKNISFYTRNGKVIGTDGGKSTKESVC
jgi:Ran-binding protein 9/10